MGQTKEPGNKLFRQFKSSFLAIEQKLEKKDLVQLDLSKQPMWLQSLGKETLSWALDIYDRGVFPRDDYEEFLTLVIFHLGGEVKTLWPLKMPGPDHNTAGWLTAYTIEKCWPAHRYFQ